MPTFTFLSMHPSEMAEQQENHTPTIVTTVAVLWVLAYIAVGARFCGRFVGRTKLWWDDWLILVAAVGTFVPPSIISNPFVY